MALKSIGVHRASRLVRLAVAGNSLSVLALDNSNNTAIGGYKASLTSLLHGI